MENLTEEQRQMRERQEEDEAYAVREKDRAAFIIVNLFPSDGRRFRFIYATSVIGAMRDINEINPDAILVREYRCHPENETFVLSRVRNTRGVVMHNRTVADLHDPLETIRKIDVIAKKHDLVYKIDK